MTLNVPKHRSFFFDKVCVISKTRLNKLDSKSSTKQRKNALLIDVSLFSMQVERKSASVQPFLNYSVAHGWF